MYRRYRYPYKDSREEPRKGRQRYAVEVRRLSRAIQHSSGGSKLYLTIQISASPADSVSYASEAGCPEKPMQLGGSHFPREEGGRRLNNKLCLYCGKAGHFIATCPLLRNKLADRPKKVRFTMLAHTLTDYDPLSQFSVTVHLHVSDSPVSLSLFF